MSSIDLKLAYNKPVTLPHDIAVKVQDLINKAADSLLLQGTRCTSDGSCANKNKEGKHCAFGWVLHHFGIADEDMPVTGSYKLTLATLKANHVFKSGSEEFSISHPDLNGLWYGIQTIHDQSFAKTTCKPLCDNLFKKLCIAYPQINFCKWKDIASGDWLMLVDKD